jgi:hypothetical protein
VKPPSSVRRISAAAWREFLGEARWPEDAEPEPHSGAKPERERKPGRDSGLFLQDL